METGRLEYCVTAAARANWKGYLRLSLVSCPIALFPAVTESEKIRFHQLNRHTGNRIELRRVDSVTGEELEPDDIVRGYEVSKGRFVEITVEDFEAAAVESTRTIDIDEFVPRDEIDDLYNIRPYFIAPDGKIGADAFATIREAIKATAPRRRRRRKLPRRRLRSGRERRDETRRARPREASMIRWEENGDGA